MHSIFMLFDDIYGSFCFLNRLGLKLVMFFGIVKMFVLNDFVRHRFVAQISGKMCVCPGFRDVNYSLCDRVNVNYSPYVRVN